MAHPYAPGQWQTYVVEDYRYDALGRRVWARTRKRCEDHNMTLRQATACRVGLIRRTVWDGDQVLAEIQMPWTLQDYNQTFTWDSTEMSQYWENDTAPVSLKLLRTGTGYAGDPNPYFGHVVYAGLRGVDQGLAVTRVHYVWGEDWNYPSQTVDPPLEKPAFTIVPFWNARGDAPQGVLSNGELTLCDPDGSYTKCVGLQWLWDVSSADRQRNLARGSWHGTLLESQRDQSGLGYARNRYYDRVTGRFIQEDPIGVAGGLNLYGFANGDPINFSDPFGLRPPELQWDARACIEWDVWNLNRLKVNATYCSAASRLTFRDSTGATVLQTEAGNNTMNPQGDPLTLNSYGPAPSGTYPVGTVMLDPAPSESYGPAFFPIGAPGSIVRRRGLGIHGGRSGPQAKTNGCIRVSNQAITQMASQFGIVSLTIQPVARGCVQP